MTPPQADGLSGWVLVKSRRACIHQLEGRVFGNLTVEAETRRAGKRAWVCRCICGNAHAVTTTNLLNGGAKSCGCTKVAASAAAIRTHGDAPGGHRPKEYATWAKMIGRCHNPTDGGWRYYGARGITVCDRWRNSYADFLADMGRAPSPRHSIDRRDNDGNYEPGNCRWATPAAQARNTRRTVRIDGVCLRDICTQRGLSYGAVQARLRRGHPAQIALSPMMGHAYRELVRGAL